MIEQLRSEQISVSSLPNTILEIPLPDFSFDTHGTSGEHMTKARRDWEDFTGVLKNDNPGLDLLDQYKDFLAGEGIFYRAYDESGRFTAGLIISPTTPKSYEIDAIAAQGEEGVAAAAFSTVLSRKFFGNFSGAEGLSRINYLSVDWEKVGVPGSFARAVYDYGLVKGSKLFIPMPGKNNLQPQERTNEELECLRIELNKHSITGIIPYITGDQETYAIIEEFYREGILTGTLSSHYRAGVYRSERISTIGRDKNGQEIPLQRTDLERTALAVHFLKSLAVANPEAAGLILS